MTRTKGAKDKSKRKTKGKGITGIIRRAFSLKPKEKAIPERKKQPWESRDIPDVKVPGLYSIKTEKIKIIKEN